MRKAGSKATPWSVKGIDDATRDVAREAAQEAGLTLGAWIDRAILRHAGITPIPANDASGGGAGTEADADQLETEVAAAEGRIEGQLRPVGLAVARIAQRMVQLERGLKSLPPDWPSTLTVAPPASDSVTGEVPTGEDHVPGGMAEDEPEDEIVFPATADEAKPDPAEEDWDARWNQFKTELAAETTDDAPSAADPTEEKKPAPTPAPTASALPQRPVRRHIPGKLIVGGLVLVIGVGSGIALMSQSERLGVKPALQRTADAVIGLGEDIQAALRNGTRWVEDRAWQLRGGREETDSSSAAPASPEGPTASAPAALEAAPPAMPQPPIQGIPQEAAKPSPSSAGSPSPATPAPKAPLPVPPKAAPEPTASGDTSAAAGPSIAALPDRSTKPVETKPAASAPKAAAPGFAGLVEQRARQGDPEAQHDLAVLYATGDGRPQDMREAAYWFREAAIQGVPGAQYNLGVLYEKGTGVQQDDVRALLWYHSAAERNHPRAQYNLGLFYAQGRGIPVNYAEARKWLRRASDQGMTPALFELGQMEERGLGDAPDRSKARALYAQAAALGDQAAAERLVAMPLDNSPPPAASAGSASKGEAVAATSSPLSPEAERETIRAIQHILIRLGYEIGAADGLLGDRTREGIRDYQRRHDLPVNGTPSALLLQHMLQVMSKDPAAGAPPASPTAARSSVR
ncbi:SEL1-like repeat protein [Oceanibaculum indicum]|uniref:SEL1-like repeat protein n=1 Tax=Oceanibaculum indicum TaxID=526216 RepID=UPI0002E7E39A|nr:SEL1-like repeat protein [Oceanibaculum indicum]